MTTLKEQFVQYNYSHSGICCSAPKSPLCYYCNIIKVGIKIISLAHGNVQFGTTKHMMLLLDSMMPTIVLAIQVKHYLAVDNLQICYVLSFFLHVHLWNMLKSCP